MRKILSSLLLLFMIILPSLGICANHYIRAGAAGNGSGSDWQNAMTALPTTFVRGDTYYVADGEYVRHTFSTAENGSTYVYIKKATVSDHGTEIGWSPTYGDGVANFSGSDVWTFQTGYWDIDGVVGGGTSGHGFKITVTGDGTKGVLNLSTPVHYVKISHVEMQHRGEDNGEYKDDLIYVNSAGSSNWTISHCYLHDVNRTHVLLVGAQAFTFQNSYFARRHVIASSTAPHGESFSINSSPSPANHIIRNNVFWDILGTGFIVIKDSVQDNVYIYGNLFYQTNTTRYGISNGAICNTGGDTNSFMYVHNNTFYNINTVGGGRGSIVWFENGSNNFAYNNILYNCSANTWVGTSHDYNWYYNSGSQSEPNLEYGRSDIFAGINNRNFRLIRGTNPGISLSTSFSRDMDGKTRGLDGVWDRGAYEFSGGISDATLDAPTGLRIVSQ